MDREGQGIAIRPEMELLLLSLRRDGNSDALTRSLTDAIDWSEFSRLVRLHGIGPFVYDRCRSIPSAGIPPEVLEGMREAYQANIYRNLLHSRQLIRILMALRKEDVDVLPMKGITLALLAYRNPDLRRSGDIDILVRPGDLHRVVSTLEREGFSPHMPFSGSAWSRLLHGIKGSDTFSARMALDIDLHWRLSDLLSRIPMEEDLFQNRITLDLFSREAPSLSQEDTLIFLSLHGTKHLWGEIRWIVDIIQLIENNPTLDIPGALATAADRGCRRSICIALQLARMVGGIGFGREVSDLLDRDHRALQAALYFFDQIRAERVPDIRSQLAVLMRSQERFGHSVRYFLYGLFFFVPTQRSGIPLPRALHPLYLLLQSIPPGKKP